MAKGKGGLLGFGLINLPETQKKKSAFEYEIQGNYGHGWEMVTTEETLEDAKKQLRTYDENEPNPHRIKKVKATD